MLARHLSYAEFRHVARLCQSVDFSRLPAGFDVRRYLLLLLGPGAPSAALAVSRLTDEEVDLLRAELAEFQGLVA